MEFAIEMLALLAFVALGAWASAVLDRKWERKSATHDLQRVPLTPTGSAANISRRGRRAQPD
ncbi:MAG TPA: hypothetical protein VF984_01385 [Actinomycetota bacterium]